MCYAQGLAMLHSASRTGYADTLNDVSKNLAGVVLSAPAYSKLFIKHIKE